MFGLPEIVTIIATDNDEAKWYAKNAKQGGMKVKETDIWDGPVPPDSFVWLGNGVRMATPEYMFLRKANQLPYETAVVIGCALLSPYETKYTSNSLGPNEVRLRDEPHTTVEDIVVYLLPIILTDEGAKAYEILRDAVKYYPLFQKVCETLMADNQ